jgi:hypothetical protein
MHCGEIIGVYQGDYLLGGEGQGRDRKEVHIESRQ